MPAPRRPRAAAARSARTSHRQAHIKTSFNKHDRVADRPAGNVIAWSRPAAQASRGRASRRRSRAGDGGPAARKASSRASRRSRSSSRARLRTRDRDPLAAGRRPRRHRVKESPAGTQRLPPAQAAPRLIAREDPWPETLQPQCSNAGARAEAVPQGRALPHRQVRSRAARIPAR